ncbi:hypothetical protein ACQY0O_004891 [Thecaphora frezii]
MTSAVDNRPSMSEEKSLDKETTNPRSEPLALATQSIADTEGVIDLNELNQVLDEAEIEAAGQSKGASWYVWGLTSFAAIGGLLFGYDTGAISSVLVSIGDDLGGRPVTDGDKEFITSALTLGAIISALFAGLVADRIGRKWTLLICDVFFVAGVVIQCCANHKWVMIPGRLVMGFGVGGAAQMVPVYIQEIAPTRYRGRLTVINSVVVTFGQVVAYAIGAAFQNIPAGWRWMIAVGGFPPIFQAVGIHFFMPESPRHLVKSGKYEAAEAAITRMYPLATPDEIKAKIMVLKRHIEVDDMPIKSKVKLLWTDLPTRRATFLCSMLLFAQQLCGFNSLMYFSASIFKAAGLSNPTATGLIISGTNCLFTLVAVKYIDRFGRRKFLLITMPLVVVFLCATAIVFNQMLKPTDQHLIEGFHYKPQLTSLMLVFMVFYVASYAPGLGCVPWQHGEFFGTQTRMVGTSVSTAANWTGNLIISSTFLKLMNSITPSGAFGFYAALTFLFFLMVYFLYPETAMLSLEEVRRSLEGGYNVRKSLKVRNEKVELWKRQQQRKNEKEQSI